MDMLMQRQLIGGNAYSAGQMRQFLIMLKSDQSHIEKGIRTQVKSILNQLTTTKKMQKKYGKDQKLMPRKIVKKLLKNKRK